MQLCQKATLAAYPCLGNPLVVYNRVYIEFVYPIAATKSKAEVPNGAASAFRIGNAMFSANRAACLSV